IEYYDPSFGEHGQLLSTAARMMDRGTGRRWLIRHERSLSGPAGHLRDRLHETGKVRLAVGVPEADERGAEATYFHNNAWIVRGFENWARLLRRLVDFEKLRSFSETLGLCAKSF
ncbi:MAG: hypothetical protein JTT11_10795, partial [Candidatus Brockarchaeota archaeon]|nr:hypothetical protein [Candidatus Brockarchaeota archaeon]